ncbi:flagellar biogenesis protein FlhF [Syntrophotalea carbinolica DSM 2380]|uniref:Flagellar biosynthesis protein FlhF n=1 Tax=Syntrophotalea carbinolica (strain DSM 2380 / NBRC 103641 / GraBd1) TaxID=338963 RepID=Q3A5E7_SYNC1|nr:flagellar biosynthesis protein FlhF [Syntrophotalea carbinolica]ABA88410.1 flagellar biogenesis protein FlhF [Syntrophotalea carbinolica DSM 2380]
MLVRVFEAETMPLALKKVKEALGPDALILSTRTVRKSGLGVFRKPICEVTAAIDTVEPEADTAAPQTPPPNAGKTEEQDELTYQDLWQKTRPGAEAAYQPHIYGTERPKDDLKDVRNEIDELKALVKQLAKPAEPASPPPIVAAPPRKVQQGAEVQEMALLHNELDRLGICGEAAASLEQYAWDKLSPRQLGDPQGIREFLVDAIARLITVYGPLQTEPRRQKRIALVGPTGVGKTTTIAKMAAKQLLNGTGRVALVTIDTYRIAAVEQLKVYGEIMNLPVEVVTTPEQLHQALARHQDKELILIDTAGRSPRDDMSIAELAAFLGKAETENLLVLSATTRDRELTEAVQRFSRIPLHSLVFTKLDECEQCGTLLNISLTQQLPLSFLTNGQRVPEDLVEADTEAITGFITGSYREKAV